MKRSLRILGCALLLAMPAVAADLHTLLSVPRQRIETADFRVSGRLVRVDSHGARTTLPVTIQALGSADVLHVLVSTGGPKPSRILLEMHLNGETRIWLAHPGDKTAAVLPFSQWSDGPLGPGFSYEDFLEQQYFWPDQSISGPAQYGARLCDILLSTPGPSLRTHYEKVKTWLDHSIGFPVYAEKSVKGTGEIKEFTYMGLRHDQGVWSAKQIQEKIRGQAGTTLLIIDRGSAKANLHSGNFTPDDLTRFQE